MPVAFGARSNNFHIHLGESLFAGQGFLHRLGEGFFLAVAGGGNRECDMGVVTMQFNIGNHSKRDNITAESGIVYRLENLENGIVVDHGKILAGFRRD